VAIRDDEIDALLPARFDDDSGESEHWSQRENGEWICPFVEIISLRRISGRVHQSLHMNVSLRQLAYEDKVRLREDLFNELTGWRQRLDTLVLDVFNPNHNSLSPFLTRAWYDVIYFNAAITLHRPSPLFPFDSRPDAFEDLANMRKLWTFSRSSVLKYSELLQQRRLNYSWITLYAVFMAGLSYVYSVSRISKIARQPSEVVSYMDVISDTRLCSNILVAICERWNDARRSCSIFDRLSMAAIQEAVGVTIQPHAGTFHATNNADFEQQSEQLPGSDQNMGTGLMHPAMNASDGDGAPRHQNDRGISHLAEHNVEYFDFENYFQELHGSLIQPGSYPSNEVLLGFDQDWFGDQFTTQRSER
jgi:hypothetical protein